MSKIRVLLVDDEEEYVKTMAERMGKLVAENIKHPALAGEHTYHAHDPLDELLRLGQVVDATVRLVRFEIGPITLTSKLIDGTFPAHHPDPTVEAAQHEQIQELTSGSRSDR